MSVATPVKEVVKSSYATFKLTLRWGSYAPFKFLAQRPCFIPFGKEGVYYNYNIKVFKLQDGAKHTRSLQGNLIIGLVLYPTIL
jgi:hypothetical protein